MVETLWEVFLIVLLVIGILTLIKSAIEVWNIKPIRQRRNANKFVEAMEDIVKQAMEDVKKKECNKETKTTKKNY